MAVTACRHFFLMLGLWLLVPSVGWAAAQAVDQSRPLLVDAMHSELSLIPSATFFKDADGNQTVDAILRLPLASGSRSDRDVVSFGFSRATYWFVVPLRNPETQERERLLIFDPTWLDDIQATMVGADGTRQIFTGGDRLPFAQRAEPYRQTNFAVIVPPEGSTLVVRIRTRDPFYVGMQLMTRSAFSQFRSKDASYFDALYGALASLLLFNLVLFLSARDKVYLSRPKLVVHKSPI